MNNFIIKEGDILKVRSDLTKGMAVRFGVNFEMEEMRGDELEVIDTEYGGSMIRFKNVDYSWSRGMIEEIIRGNKNEQEVEETRDYLDFKEGDRVIIRSKQELEKIYGRDETGIKTYVPFIEEMEKLCGKKATIRDIYGKFVELKFSEKERVSDDITFTTDMIEIFKKEGVKREVKKENDEENDKIIEEMISKVDVKKFKKILASAFEVPGTQLKGVDKILHNWARAKIDLYRLLGNEIKVTKTVEYTADEQYWNEQKIKLAQDFPGIGYMLMDIPSYCFRKNEYTSFSSTIDRLMKDVRNGMKLTTFLSSAFKNQEFDTALSKIIDGAKISGNIAISIDPVDFLTMSFNQSGWCSCHTISHHGESKNFGEFVRRYI